MLSSIDANADKVVFDQAGFGGFPVFDFGRMGKRPDGSEAELSFSLAFLREPASADVMTLVCQHKRPENFWFKELQAHKNGVARVASAIFTADSPTDHQYFLQAWTGIRDPRSTSLGDGGNVSRFGADYRADAVRRCLRRHNASHRRLAVFSRPVRRRSR